MVQALPFQLLQTLNSLNLRTQLISTAACLQAAIRAERGDWPQLRLCIPSVEMRLTVSLLALCAVTVADLTGDAQILEKCLSEISSPERIDSDLRKLARYANWTSEELPCLMRCLASEKGWFDIQANRWHKQRLAEELGADIYNYCRYELRRKTRDGCTYAHRGLRCLKQAELHAGNSLTTLLLCSSQLNATNVQLLQYSQLKPNESLPCLFQCFADALRLYDEAGNWRLLNWQQAFGPSRQEPQQDYSACRTSDEQRRLAASKCAWMYDEYLCWERLNGNLNVTNVV